MPNPELKIAAVVSLGDRLVQLSSSSGKCLDQYKKKRAGKIIHSVA